MQGDIDKLAEDNKILKEKVYDITVMLNEKIDENTNL